jgi:hypothetical protein
VRLVRYFRIPFPEVNAQNNHRSHTQNAQPPEHDASRGHAFAINAKRIAANLPPRKVAKNQSSDGPNATHPKEAAGETSDG